MDVFKRLRSYYWPYRHTLYVATLSMGLLTAVGLLRPYLMKLLIDRVITAGEYDLLPLLAGLVIAVAVVRGLFNYGRQYLGDLFGQSVVYELRNALYHKLQRLHFGYYDEAQTGNLMSRLVGDVEAFRMFLSFGFIWLVDLGMMFVFGLIAMFLINVPLTLASLAVMPALVFVSMRFDRLIRPVFSDIRKALADLTTSAQETISGVRTVKSFAREGHEVDRFLNRNEQYLHDNLSASALWAKFFPLMELAGNVATAVLIWYGGGLVIAEQLSLGDLAAFFSLVAYLTWPIRDLGYVLNLYNQSVAAGDRLLEILDAEEEITEGTDAVQLPAAAGRVEFHNVSFSYGDEEALSDINLVAEPGTVTALLGTTGAGKSSLVQLIPRFYDVTAGRVTVDGVDVRDLALDSLRSQVAIVFQETFLFSATIRENIAYGRRDATDEEIELAARRARAHEFIAELPRGYDTIVGERGLGLSGGQRQRIALARALLADPAILILDDATSSVDAETEHLIQEALQQVMAGRTTFVIAHRLSTLKDADQIIVIDGGRIVEQGTHDELVAGRGLYRRIYDIQFRDEDNDEVQEAAGTGTARAAGQGGCS